MTEFYGEGVEPDGVRWGNAKYPLLRDYGPPWPLPAGVVRLRSRRARSALRVLQWAVGVRRDGVLGPQTWAAPTAPPTKES